MSHFSVAVLHSEEEDIEELLAPYEETKYNPNSKWDWYKVGGRWENTLILKNGEKSSSAKLKDIDFSIKEESYNYALQFWDTVVGDKLFDPQDMPFYHWEAEDYVRLYGDREHFAKISASFSTFAVVTPDGAWHEQGKMGWFGLVVDGTPDMEYTWEKEYFKNFLENADQELFLTIVDCHI